MAANKEADGRMNMIDSRGKCLGNQVASIPVSRHAGRAPLAHGSADLSVLLDGTNARPLRGTWLCAGSGRSCCPSPSSSSSGAGRRRDAGRGAGRLPLPASAKVIGRSLRDTRIREETGCSVIALEMPEQTVVNPDPSQPIPRGAELILIGTAEGERRFKERFA
ncbi:cation:proton antiporter regulatory subunit [Cystobacter fuscus]|uniref:cation:proton antiporter regulatory subunit n=1 Tax=Cystobacter fuscus TaxID=43 RepID=UPI002B313600|nr:hypothetical protein F0U63_19345 [Cystobacter fuscus]